MQSILNCVYCCLVVHAHSLHVRTYVPHIVYICTYACVYVVSRVVSSLNGDMLSNHMRTYVARGINCSEKFWPRWSLSVTNCFATDNDPQGWNVSLEFTVFPLLRMWLFNSVPVQFNAVAWASTTSLCPHTLVLAAPLPIHVQQAGASKVIGQLAANPGLAQELIEVGADMFVHTDHIWRLRILSGVVSTYLHVVCIHTYVHVNYHWRMWLFAMCLYNTEHCMCTQDGYSVDGPTPHTLDHVEPWCSPTVTHNWFIASTYVRNVQYCTYLGDKYTCCFILCRQQLNKTANRTNKLLQQ